MKNSKKGCSCTYCSCDLYQSVALLFLGISLGIIMTYPIVGTHPLKWSGVFLAIAAIIYLFPMLKGKK